MKLYAVINMCSEYIEDIQDVDFILQCEKTFTTIEEANKYIEDKRAEEQAELNTKINYMKSYVYTLTPEETKEVWVKCLRQVPHIRGGSLLNLGVGECKSDIFNKVLLNISRY